MLKLREFYVISDTHGLADEQLRELIPVFNSGDLLVHLGDGVSDLKKIENLLTCPVICVRGNNDVFTSAEREVVLETQFGKMLFTHGHDYHVKRNTMSLYYGALEKRCSYAFYGHTHEPEIDVKSGVTLVNPGSMCPSWRQKSSYCVVYEDGRQFAIKIVSITS